MKFRAVLVVLGAAALVGCGNEYEGEYVGSVGLITAATMKVDGDRAIVDTINTGTREVIGTDGFDAEVKHDKLILSRRGPGSPTFVYGVSVDERGLECLSDSCKGFGKMGAGGMPREWRRYEPKDG